MTDKIKRISKIIDQIDTINELKEVSGLVRVRWRDIQRVAIADLENGMKVEFMDKSGGRVVGVIRGLTANNVKSVPVITGAGQRWRVAPDFLKIVE